LRHPHPANTLINFTSPGVKLGNSIALAVNWPWT